MGREKDYINISMAIKKLVMISGLFFLTFALLIAGETGRGRWGPGTFGILLFPCYLAFAIWYGIYSYKITRRIWLPMIIIYIMGLSFSLIVSLVQSYGSVNIVRLILGVLIRSLYKPFSIPSITIPLISSVITKSKIDEKEKVNEK